MEISEERARLVDQRRLYEAALYEVALSGNVSEFKSLVEKDQLILDRVLASYSHETPLHIAALRGHLDLTKELLKRCPNMARELDSFRGSPLHLASASGHTDIVRELLQVNVGVCGFGDEDGRTPLHLAAMKGRVEVIRELVRRRPASSHASGHTDIVRELLQVNVGVCGFGDEDGRTPLHLAAMKGRVEVIRELVRRRPDSVPDLNEDEFVNHRDNRGNTILHLAAALKQVKAIEYLVQIEAVKGQATVKNRDGFTALDILEHDPIMDWKSTEVRGLLIQAAAGGGGVNSPIRAVGISDQNPSAALEITTPAAPSEKPQAGCCSCKLVKKCMCGIWNKYFEIDEKWIEVARGNLIIAATLTATVAFQAGITPPGSVWQSEEDFLDSTSKLKITSPPRIGSGTSILNTVREYFFIRLMIFNTISFISSVCVILLMISGLPFNNKFSISVLTLAMCTNLTFLVLAYLQSLYLLIPGPVVYRISSFALVPEIVFLLALLFNLTRILVWTVKKVLQCCCCLINPFRRCWNIVIAGGVLLVLRKPASTDENEPHHRQTA